MIRGKLKSVLSLKFDDTEYVSDITSFELSSDDADADSQTYYEYNQGKNRKWSLTVNAIWDGGSNGSLHAFLWDNSGSSIDWSLRPYMTSSLSAIPEYFGLVRIPYKPDISIEAGTDSTFEYEFEVVGTPLKTFVASGTSSPLYQGTYTSLY